jgi:hypothetical protein
MSVVTAVVVGTRGACTDAVAREPLVALLTIPSPAELRDAAQAAESELLWIVDSGAAPDPGSTLAALLEVAEEPAVSLPVDAAGGPCEQAIGRFTDEDVPELLRAAEARRVPLRRTDILSLLVRRAAVLAEAPPDPGRFGRYAGAEWTGRLFARTTGMLVPASRVRVAPPERGTPLHAMRAARAGGWGKGETLRELHRTLAR